MFEMMSMCYLAGCTSPEDISSNSPQFPKWLRFRAEYLSSTSECGFFEYTLLLRCAPEKKYRDLNLAIKLAIIHYLSLGLNCLYRERRLKLSMIFIYHYYTYRIALVIT